MKPRIIVILGPTASGKSDLAVTLAQKLNGEVISADSRQIFRGLDIGSGKITKKEMRGIPHHLLDIASPKNYFSVNDFQVLAYQAIDNIITRGKTPIICGGTGFYIQSIVDGIVFPDVSHNEILREKLNKLTSEKLYEMLQKLDMKRAKEIHINNKQKIIRAIEIAKSLGKSSKIKTKPKYEVLQIGIKFTDELLKERINTRLTKRVKLGMLEEARNLHKKGLSYKKMKELGLEYRYLALHLEGKISYEEMVTELQTKIWQFSKRQMTWFKRDPRIHWVEINKRVPQKILRHPRKT